MFVFAIISLLVLNNTVSLLSLVNNSPIQKPKSIWIIIYILYSFTYIFLRFNNCNPLLTATILLMYYGQLLLCTYKSSTNCTISKLILSSTLYLSIDSIIQSMLKTLISIFFDLQSKQAIQIYIMVPSSLILLFFINKFKAKKINIQPHIIPTYIYILIIFTLIISGGLIESQLTLTNIQIQSKVIKGFTVITIFLLLFIIALLVFNCISKAYFENVSSILEKQVNTQVDYYKKANRLNEELRNFKHDYKNHMLCLQGLLDGQEYDEAKEYIHDITLYKTILSKEYSSGNTIANAILSDKSEHAEEIGAEIQFSGVIFENIPAADLCTILSNALDNAIEACEKISVDEPKIITVKCSYIKHIQFITVSNPVAENVKITNNAVETSKSDKNIHGIGLYNIRRTVAKYDGEFEISCNDKSFVLDIGFKVQ